MTDRKRDPLPEGYKFGDARPSVVASCGHGGPLVFVDRPGARDGFCATCGQTKSSTVFQKDWNVIEGEHFTTNRDLGDEA